MWNITILPPIRTQEQDATPNDDYRDDGIDHLSLPPALHKRRLPTVHGDGLDIDGKPADETGQTHAPEDDA